MIRRASTSTAGRLAAVVIAGLTFGSCGQAILTAPDGSTMLMFVNPDFIAALMRPDAMTIPANTETDGTIREENTGPVFVIDPETGGLVMRYTARKRNIRWRHDATTQAALRALERVMREDPHVFRVKLAPGEGVISNNVLHDRIGFDVAEGVGPGRLIYRIRSYDSIGHRTLGAERA